MYLITVIFIDVFITKSCRWLADFINAKDRAEVTRFSRLRNRFSLADVTAAMRLIPSVDN